jgi:PAS domain-containing protein
VNGAIPENTYRKIRFNINTPNTYLYRYRNCRKNDTWEKGEPRPKSANASLSGLHGAIGLLLSAPFESPSMGVVLLDSQFRFRAINEALATMNGLPLSGYIGKKLRYALGSSARKVEGFVGQVLFTSEPIFNQVLSAKLPGRRDVGHWVETCLPIRDLENRVTQVAAFAVELTELRNLQVFTESRDR